MFQSYPAEHAAFVQRVLQWIQDIIVCDRWPRRYYHDNRAHVRHDTVT